MTQKELFEAIQHLNPVLDEYVRKGSANITIEQKLLLQQVYKELYPHVRTQLTCDSCIVSYLHFIRSHYDKHYPLYLKSLESAPTTAVPQPEEKKVRRKPSKK